MAEDHRVTEFVARNREAVKTHEPIVLLKDSLFKNGPVPGGLVVILTCFDARLSPSQIFGLKPGEANIMGNAGGRVDDGAIRSLIVLDNIATVGTVVVLHHSDCGLVHFSDDDLKEKLKKISPEDGPEIEKMTLGEIKDLRQSVVDDMKILEANPFLKHLKVLGFVYDIIHGNVEEVKID